jgi:4-amino-4-deoxy-L-arabinose transferase-like glycosyltransferase
MPDDPKTVAAASPGEVAEAESPAAARSPWPEWAPLGVAVAVPAVFFFALLTRSGLWDPYELNVADLSRRIALNLYGASGLALGGADNSLPHLNDLGRPQLPFSSIAIGFRLFGLHEWAGRLPLALWGLLGVLATYAFVARLFDRRTGAYAAVVLSTMPLYFVQARSMLGDICTMAGLAMAFGGLAVSVFDRKESPAGFTPTTLAERAPWLGMAAIGLLVGFESRGGLLGLAVPLLGVGLAWATARVSVRRSAWDGAGDGVGMLSLVAGIAVAAMAVRAVSVENKSLDLWIGTLSHAPSKYPTFDFYFASVGHALAPWSAFLPFAFGRMLLTPVESKGTATGNGSTTERESLGRVAVLVGATVAFVAHAYLVSRTDLVAFSGPALCAVACAIAIRDLERGAHASIAVGLGTLVIAAVLHHDFHELPEKAYQTFGVTGATFPEGFKDTALKLWWVVLGGFALCALLTWIERDAERVPFHPSSYARVLRALREAYDGILSLIYFATVAGASLAGVLVVAGTRFHAHWLPQMSSTIRDIVMRAWWVIAFVPLGAIFSLLFACDVWLWAFGRSNPVSKKSLGRGFQPFEELLERLRPEAGAPKLPEYEWFVGLLVVAPLLFLAIPAVVALGLHESGSSLVMAICFAIPSGVAFFLAMGIAGDLLRHRAPGLALGGAIVGAILCFVYYPALANQLSPKEVFESYRHICPGAPLGMLGVGGRTSAYYAGGQPQALSDPQSAYKWLAAGGSGERRCLALKAEELPQLNKLWREGSDPKTNLPVLDARSSQILLASSALRPGEKNESPLSAMILLAPPNPQHKLDVNMDDKLQVLGFDLIDERGHAIDTVNPGVASRMRTYYRVLAPVTTEWEAFIHIDGYKRRHNGDHKPLSGKYPMALWLPGDLIVDDYEFKLEPNFTPGSYQIYFGLFVGDTRLKVKSGPSDGDNRINGGTLRVQ